MHYEVYFSKISSEWCGTRPFLSAWIDVAATLLLFLLCTAGRRKSAFVLTYSTLMVFVVANMVYSRFFNRYITPVCLCIDVETVMCQPCSLFSCCMI